MTRGRLAVVLGLLVGAVWGYAWRTGAVAEAFGAAPASPAVKEFAAGKVTVAFLDVGQGDCVFIHTANGKNVLIDAGEGANPDNPYSKQYDAGTEVVVPFLRDHGVTRLDAIVLSHPHSDHGGGLEAVLQMEGLEIGAFYDPGFVTASKFYRNVLRLLKERHPEAEFRTVFEYVGAEGVEESERPSDYRLVREMIGRNILDGDPSAELRILGPLRVNTQSNSFHNDNSLVTLLRAGNVTVLLPGDAENGELGDLARVLGPALRCLVLKNPHHGSRLNLHAGFIAAAAPRFHVYQAGADNTYGHPHKDNFAKYAEIVEPDPTILRNDMHGDIVLVTDGREYAFETERHPDPDEVKIGRESPRRGRRRNQNG